MGEVKPAFELTLFGLNIPIYTSIIYQWVIMIIIALLSLVLTSRLEVVPKGKQIFAEYLTETINNLVEDNMGKKYKKYAPYIGTLAAFLLFMNLFDILGLKPPTSDYSVALGLAIMSFVIIQTNAIVKNGIGHYLRAFAEPFSFMLPLNIIERLIVPVSLSLRLFGNTFAAVIIVEFLYKALAAITNSIHFPIPIFQAVIPIPFHIYFSIFDGVIQMVIFVMLTMIFIKIIAEH